MLIPRILTALFLVAIVLGGLFKATPEVWEVGVLILAFLALFESAKLSQVTRPIWQWVYAVVGTAIIFLSLQTLDLLLYQITTLIVMLGVVAVVYRYQRTQGRIGLDSKLLMSMFCFLLIMIFATALVELQALIRSELLLLSMAIVWAMDTGAYFSGRAFGKRKLASYVSPGKSWEGVWGGALSAFLLSSVSLYFLMPKITSTDLLMLAFALTVIALLSVFGDLFESVLKRQADLKDSGSLLPGHGGVLDRVDSLLVAMPLTYLLWLGYF